MAPAGVVRPGFDTAASTLRCRSNVLIPRPMPLLKSAIVHDTLVRRLAGMLIKLNRGESLSPRALAEEFNVGLRTIQRDLVQRFALLDLVKQDGRYRLPAQALGRLSTADIQAFAELAGIQRLFPSLSHVAIVALLKNDGP